MEFSVDETRQKIPPAHDEVLIRHLREELEAVGCSVGQYAGVYGGRTCGRDVEAGAGRVPESKFEVAKLLGAEYSWDDRSHGLYRRRVFDWVIPDVLQRPWVEQLPLNEDRILIYHARKEVYETILARDVPVGDSLPHDL